MINEREELLSYIKFPEYISHIKQDYGYLGYGTFTKTSCNNTGGYFNSFNKSWC